MDTRFLAIGAILVFIAAMVGPLAEMTTVYYSSGTPSIEPWGSIVSTDPQIVPPSVFYTDYPFAFLKNLQPGEVTSAVAVDSRDGKSYALLWDGTVLGGGSWYEYAAGYTTPSAGVTWNFEYTVVTTTVGTLTATGYLKTETPSGYFQIKFGSGTWSTVNVTSKIRATDPIWYFKYVNTAMASTPQSAKVKITEPDGTTEHILGLNAGNSWSSSYNVGAKYGTYKVEGWASYAGVEYKFMSIFGLWSSELPIEFSWVTGAQLLFGLPGVACLVLGFVRKPRVK